MLAIKAFSWICYGVGALGLLIGLVDSPFSLIGLGLRCNIWCILTGYRLCARPS